MASFNSFNRAKYEIVSFIGDRTINQFIDVGYFLTGCLIHWYFIYFFLYRQESITKYLQTCKNYEEAYVSGNQAENKNQLEWQPIVLGIGTVTLAILKSIMYTELNSWSLKGLILDHSYNVGDGFFFWKPDQLYDSSLKDEYGTTFNWKTCMMGIFGLTTVICWNISVDLSKDLIIWVAFVNKNQMMAFGQKIMESLQQKKATKKNSEENDDKCWRMYRQVLESNSVTNSTYHNMFLVNHLHSFVMSSYWLTHLLNQKAKLRVVLFLGYNVAKGIFAFFPARKTAAEVRS